MKPYHNTIIVNATNNRCAGAGGLGKGNTPGVQSRVAVVVGEVKTRHRDDTKGCKPGQIERKSKENGQTREKTKDRDDVGRWSRGGREEEREEERDEVQMKLEHSSSLK